MLVGGQALGGRTLAAARQALPHAQFIQTFACSEACSSITFLPLSQSSSVARRGTLEDGSEVAGACVGYAGHHVEVQVVSEGAVAVVGKAGVGSGSGGSARILEAGRVGRIRTRGAHVMLGYLGRAALPVGSWLYTGDWGFVDADGALCFVSRASDRINSGGEKVCACACVWE